VKAKVRDIQIGTSEDGVRFLKEMGELVGSILDFTTADSVWFKSRLPVEYLFHESWLEFLNEGEEKDMIQAKVLTDQERVNDEASRFVNGLLPSNSDIFLGGSRRFNWPDYNSDWDFFIYIPKEAMEAFYRKLENLGFSQSQPEYLTWVFKFKLGKLDLNVFTDLSDFQKLAEEHIRVDILLIKNPKLLSLARILKPEISSSTDKKTSNGTKLYRALVALLD